MGLGGPLINEILIKWDWKYLYISSLINVWWQWYFTHNNTAALSANSIVIIWNHGMRNLIKFNKKSWDGHQGKQGCSRLVDSNTHFFENYICVFIKISHLFMLWVQSKQTHLWFRQCLCTEQAIRWLSDNKHGCIHSAVTEGWNTTKKSWKGYDATGNWIENNKKSEHYESNGLSTSDGSHTLPSSMIYSSKILHFWHNNNSMVKGFVVYFHCQKEVKGTIH